MHRGSSVDDYLRSRGNKVDSRRRGIRVEQDLTCFFCGENVGVRERDLRWHLAIRHPPISIGSEQQVRKRRNIAYYVLYNVPYVNYSMFISWQFKICDFNFRPAPSVSSNSVFQSVLLDT